MEKNDRTWTLNVKVYHDSENVSDDVKIRVRGNYSIGHVMALIGQEVGGHNDWSDYAIWWPEKKRWLKNCQMTLDQVDVCAGNSLEFRTMHQTLQIQFPDLNVQELKVDFSVNVLQAVMKLCQMIEINHPEEWSLARPLTNQQLKQNNHHLSASPLQRYPAATISRTQKSSNNHNHNNNNNNIYNNNTINHSNGSLLSQKSYATISSNGSSINDSNHSLTGTNNPSNNDLKQTFKLILPHPKTSIEKARLNSAWLNSSISLFEQDVCENDLLLLRIKYYTFYDLKPTELSRINYIYENLKLNILQEEISCNEDEMYTMAGIMLQVGYCSGQNDRFSTTTTFNQNGNGLHHHHNHGHINNGSKCFNNNNNNNNNGSLSTISSSTSSNNDIDEVDCALETLEKELQTTSLTNELSNRRVRMLTIPQLNGELKITCQNMNGISTLARIKSTLSGDRRYFAIFKETTLYAYRPQDCDEHSRNPAKEPEIILNMINCEIRPNVMASQQRFCFQIIDSKNRNVNYLIKCSNEDQYARWFAACKQASLGHTMAHPSYNEQYNDTLKLLKIQSKVSKTPKSINKQELKNSEIDLQQFISPRFLKRRSKEQILAKIKTASEMFSDNSLIEAQMNFIKFCQKLTDYAITLFVVRFHKSKKEDLLGAMPDKLVLIDINNGSLRKTWRYKTMINWNINWEVKRMSINFRDETLEFECISADCKVIHEFIGGYIYMSMRGNQINDGFNEEQFLKLTGGWNDDDLQNEDDEDDHIAMCRREAWANLHHGLMVK